MIKRYRYGFEYKGMNYVWGDNNQLYRVPSTIGNRNYSFRKVPLIKIGNNKGYRVMDDPKTIQQLKDITEVINYQRIVNGKGSVDTPF